jgi:hypothetical protein
VKAPGSESLLRTKGEARNARVIHEEERQVSGIESRGGSVKQHLDDVLRKRNIHSTASNYVVYTVPIQLQAHAHMIDKGKGKIGEGSERGEARARRQL